MGSKDLLDLNVQNNDGDSALIVACREGHTATVKILTGFGARLDINQANHAGETAMSVAKNEEIRGVLEAR